MYNSLNSDESWDSNGLHILDLDSVWFNNIVELQRNVIEYQMDCSMFYALMPYEIERMMSDQGISVGVVNNKGELVAYSAARFPGSSRDNLGLDLGITEEELEKVVHLEVCLVNPYFRSIGLQKKMYQYLLDRIMGMDNYRYVSSTVAPWNISSVAGTLSLSLLVARLKPKYDGYLRYIFYQDLKEPIHIESELIEKVSLNDVERQQKLVKLGYYGFDIAVLPGKVEMCWGKPNY